MATAVTTTVYTSSWTLHIDGTRWVEVDRKTVENTDKKPKDIDLLVRKGLDSYPLQSQWSSPLAFFGPSPFRYRPLPHKIRLRIKPCTKVEIRALQGVTTFTKRVDLDVSTQTTRTFTVRPLVNAIRRILPMVAPLAAPPPVTSPMSFPPTRAQVVYVSWEEWENFSKVKVYVSPISPPTTTSAPAN